MCNMPPEIFRKFFQIFQISGAGDAVDVKTPNTSKQGEKDQLPMQLKILVVVLKVKVMQLKILVVVVKVLVTQLTIRMKKDQLPMQLTNLVVLLKVLLTILVVLLKVASVMAQMQVEVASVGAVQW